MTNETLVLVGYGAAMVLGFAAVGTILYYSFTRGNRYEYTRNTVTVEPQTETENA